MASHKISLPHIRIAKRNSTPKGSGIVIRILAFITGMLFISLMLVLMKYNPINVFSSMFRGAWGKNIFIRETIKSAVPLLVTSLGISLAFRMKLWNIGGEGQILIGGAAATYVAFTFEKSMPHIPLLITMFLAAVVASGLFGLIPAFCKAKWGASETLLTLMFNYIAQKFIILLQNTKSWQDSFNAFPKIRMVTFNARLPKLLNINIGWVIAIALVIIVTIYTKRTKQGFELMVVGDSHNTAKYAGISITKVILRTMFLSAALCGIAGFLQVSGADGTLSEATANGMGFTAITVAWMSKINPVAMIAVSLFISTLDRGSSRIQTAFAIPHSFSSVMTGIILIFFIASEFFLKYRFVITKKEETK